MNEFLIISILAFITIALLVTFEILARKNILSKSLSRKLLHITTGFIVVYVPFVLQNFWIVIFVGIAFSVTNFILIRKHLLKQINDSQTENFGIFYYPLSFLICTLLFWNVNKYIISVSFLIFSVGDAVAALVGGASTNKYLTRITKEPKTFNGTIAFIVSSFFLLWIVKLTLWKDLNFINYDWLNFSFLALIFSLLGGITEALSTKGTDNLSLPIILSSATMMFFVNGIDIYSFLLAFFLALLISLASFKVNFLDFGGSASTFLLALFIYGIGGWKWTVPILTFFILSSLLSKIAERLSKKDVSSIFEKGSRRDYKQVLANGGVPLLIIVMSNLLPANIDWYKIYLLSIAISTADTWSTEFGTLFAKNVYLITNFKKVMPGISGGISFIGTIGGVLGSVFIVLSAGFFIELSIRTFISIILFSLIGNLFDSLIGATIQVTYQCSTCGKLTEKKIHCDGETIYFKGVKFIDNDMVNLSSVLFISLVYFLFLIV
ncbi:MAG: DUF92 domain-containing protein [Ignavibacteria bacterium]